VILSNFILEVFNALLLSVLNFFLIFVILSHLSHSFIYLLLLFSPQFCNFSVLVFQYLLLVHNAVDHLLELIILNVEHEYHLRHAFDLVEQVECLLHGFSLAPLDVVAVHQHSILLHVLVRVHVPDGTCYCFLPLVVLLFVFFQVVVQFLFAVIFFVLLLELPFVFAFVGVLIEFLRE